jgi:hypothetical protein
VVQYLLVQLTIDEGWFALESNLEMLFFYVDNQITGFEHQSWTEPQLLGCEDHLQILSSFYNC